MDPSSAIDIEVQRNSDNTRHFSDSGILRSGGARVESSRQSVTFREGPYLTDRPNVNPQEIKRVIAASVIERAWLAYRDKKMYKLLKHSTCAAESSLSYEILRKISPKEANLLRDKGLPVKVRFR